MTDQCRLRPLEIASGAIRGTEASAADLPAVEPPSTARAAFEQVVLDALQSQPCVVSFSGGRDSSAVLAVAVHVARREGLPLPVPVSMRFPEDPSSDEDSWQDLLLRHLGIDDRVVLSFTEELDVVGPVAQETLRAHGVLFPANAHCHVPVAEQARGGAVLTGFGGDETLTTSPLCQRVNRVITRQLRPEGRDVLRAAAFYGPRKLRRLAARRSIGDPDPLPWLRPHARREALRLELDDLVDEPLRWDDSLRWWWRTRYRLLAADSLARVTAMRGATPSGPFASPRVVAALAREWGRVGVPSRAGAMEWMFGDLLPSALTARTSKATFRRTFTGPATSAFAEQWDGSGLADDLVDPSVLRRIWSGDGLAPDFRTSLLLQSAWLAAESAVGRVGSA